MMDLLISMASLRREIDSKRYLVLNLLVRKAFDEDLRAHSNESFTIKGDSMEEKVVCCGHLEAPGIATDLALAVGQLGQRPPRRALHFDEVARQDRLEAADDAPRLRNAAVQRRKVQQRPQQVTHRPQPLL